MWAGRVGVGDEPAIWKCSILFPWEAFDLLGQWDKSMQKEKQKYKKLQKQSLKMR